MDTQIFYRVSARNPLRFPNSKSDIKMWQDGNTLVGSLAYWQFTDGQIDDITNLSQIIGLDVVKAAENLFGFRFSYCPTRGLCYTGVACSTTQMGLFPMIESNGACYTAEEKGSNEDIRKEFYMWGIEGRMIAPLPEGDGFLVYPEKIISKSESLGFYNLAKQYSYKDTNQLAVDSMCEICSYMEDHYGNMWITRNSPQYKLYEEFIAYE